MFRRIIAFWQIPVIEFNENGLRNIQEYPVKGGRKPVCPLYGFYCPVRIVDICQVLIEIKAFYPVTSDIMGENFLIICTLLISCGTWKQVFRIEVPDDGYFRITGFQCRCFLNISLPLAYNNFIKIIGCEL